MKGLPDFVVATLFLNVNKKLKGLCVDSLILSFQFVVVRGRPDEIIRKINTKKKFNRRFGGIEGVEY